MNGPITRRTALQVGPALALAAAGVPSPESARTGTPPRRPLIEAYAMPQSYAAGEDVKVRLSCHGDSFWYKVGRTGNAVVGTYTRGGTVVTVGTTDWSHGLRGNDPHVARVTKNVLDRLGK